MLIGIYFIIILLFMVLVFWTWNNTKKFESLKEKIAFIVIGVAILMLITLIVFNLSKIGIKYPNKEILKQVRKIIIFIFVSINGFLSLPHIASLITDIKLR